MESPVVLVYSSHTVEREGSVTDGPGSTALYIHMPFVELKINTHTQKKSTEARSPALPPAAALWSNMSSSYAAAISALSSVEPQTSPDTTGRPAAFRPSGKSALDPPAAQTRSHEPLGCFEEQQENPADYGIGEQLLETRKPSGVSKAHFSWTSRLQVVIIVWRSGRFLWSATRWLESWDGVTSPPCGSAGTWCK